MKFVKVGKRFIDPRYVKTIQLYYSLKDSKYHVMIELSNTREYEFYDEAFDEVKGFVAKPLELGVDVSEFTKVYGGFMSKELELKEREILLVTHEGITRLKQQYNMFKGFQKQVLEEEVDSGYPAGKKAPGQKPSLHKSGAEKLTRPFNLRILREMEKSKDGFSHVTFKREGTTFHLEIVERYVTALKNVLFKRLDVDLARYLKSQGIDYKIFF